MTVPFSLEPAERMAGLTPIEGPVEVVAGAAHFLQEDTGEEVAERIAAWLSS